MKDIPSDSVDAVITDPPYGVIGGEQAWDKFETPGHFQEFTKAWLNEAYRIQKGAYACVFWSQLHIHKFPVKPFTLKHVLCWHQKNPPTSYCGGLQFGWQPCFILEKEGAPKHMLKCGSLSQDVWREDFPAFTVPVHPTLKPLPLMDKLVRKYSHDMGSGTTGCAAIKNGRNFIGIERDPGYFGIAKGRCGEWTVQKRLDLASF